MRLLLLTPGTGHYFCGSCLRDDALARALRAAGHEPVQAPLYLPFQLEEPGPELDVHMGGINVYLQQKLPGARFLPRPLARMLDAPGLLRWAARRGNMTDAAELGEMTVSMLRGETGRQSRELDELARWAAENGPFDAALLSNALLAGLARSLGDALGCPILCTLQGEAPFLDTLPPPHRETAWELLSERSRDVARFVAVSRWYGEHVAGRIGYPLERVDVVHNGIEAWALEGEPPPQPRRPATIGYLARMCPDKGLATLVDAFLLLRRRDRVPDLRLAAAGVQLDEDEPFVSALRARLEGEGLAADATFEANVTRERKVELLRSASVVSVPATYGESFGLYVLESLAAGAPVVQPDCAAFPELLEATGGGRLCRPDDPGHLAEVLEGLLLDPGALRAHADRGRRAVAERFTSEHMARGLAEACERAVRGTPQGAAAGS